MFPEIFSIGNFVINSYGLMIALAVIIIALALYRESPREKMDPDYILEAVIIATFTGVIGARLLYMILNWDYYGGRFFSSFFTRFEGLSFLGGFFCGALVLYFWARWRQIDFLRMTDLLAPYLALGYAFGRIGCFLNGCCYGKETALPWALPATSADTILRHPVQLYAALGAILIFLLLKYMRPNRPFVGFIFIAFFGFYGILRFTTEFFRHGETFFIGLTNAQVMGLLMFAASLGLILFFGGFEALTGHFRLPAFKKKKKYKKRGRK